MAAIPNQGARAQPRHEAQAAPRHLRSDLEQLHSRLVAAIEENPLTAAAIGFVLGGGLTRPALGLLIQTGSRVAADRLGMALRAQQDPVDVDERRRSAHD